MVQKPTLRGFPIARTRMYTACVRDDHVLTRDIQELNVLDRVPEFDGGNLFCAPDEVVS